MCFAVSCLLYVRDGQLWLLRVGVALRVLLLLCHSCASCTYMCSVWDIESGTEVSGFANGNEAGKVTALEFLNPHDLTYLMTGTGELLCVWGVGG